MVNEEEKVMEGSRGDYSSVGEGGGCTYSWRSRAKRLFGRVASLEDFFYFFLRYGGSLLPSIANSFDSCNRVTLCMIPYFHPESLIQCHMTKISLAKRSADQLHSTTRNFLTFVNTTGSAYASICTIDQ